MHFNSRPHGGRHDEPAEKLFNDGGFQLTPSRRATSISGMMTRAMIFQLTPSRRATWLIVYCSWSFSFQLTPSRRATSSLTMPVIRVSFQLTPSRRATQNLVIVNRTKIFQLTPSRRATLIEKMQKNILHHFNSRPHGGRPEGHILQWFIREFQLTPSRRATRFLGVRIRKISISTHALTEGDEKEEQGGSEEPISTHALTEGDASDTLSIQVFNISTHALTEGDGGCVIHPDGGDDFNSRPHGGRR